MATVLGPILYADGCDDAVWRFTVGVLTDSTASTCPLRLEFDPAPACTVGAAALAADLRPIGAGVYWCWPVEVSRDASERLVRYRLHADGAKKAEAWMGPVRVPAKGELPRIAFFSCNGFSDIQTARDTENPDALWKDVLALHERSRKASPQDAPPGFHLLLGGGDQIYADELWTTCKVLEPLALASHADMRGAELSPADAREVQTAFVALYVKRFGKAPFADALARIPLAATWDDHDIFDGWGSYPPDLQSRSKLFRQVFGCAQVAFDAFQLGGRRSTRIGGGDHRLQALTFAAGDRALEILLLDSRSERTLSQVLSPRQHRDIGNWLAGTKSRLGDAPRRHLLVVSSVPTLYMRFAPWMESVTEGFRPFHPKRIDDDMRDQWESHLHNGERNHLVMTLFEHAKDTSSRVMIVSGDVHVGSRGRYLSRDPAHVSATGARAVIEQFTCSGIVHPPPARAAFFGMRTLATHSRQVIAEHVESELLPIAGFDYLRDRNWLAIAFDEAGAAGARRTRMWAQWRTEQGPIPEQAVIEAG